MLGDSIVKNIKEYELSNHMKNCQVFVRSFLRITIRCMQDYVQPTTWANPDHIVIQVEPYDVCTSKQS